MPTMKEIAHRLRVASASIYGDYPHEGAECLRIAAHVEAMGSEQSELLTIAYLDGFAEGKKAMGERKPDAYFEFTEDRGGIFIANTDMFVKPGEKFECYKVERTE